MSIKHLLNPMDFAKYIKLRAQAHDGYIMCAVGQDPKKLTEWYFDQYKENTKQYTQALKWRMEAERVWDCQGMADGYVTEMTGIKTNVRARNNYADWCGIKGEGKIPNERKVPGAAVFMDSTYVHHVGFLIEPVNAADPSGDWYVGEARGVMYGVVITKLYSRGWNKWGWMTKYFDYSVFGDVVVEEAPEYGQRNLKRGMKGADVTAMQSDLILLNYSCGKWGADGDFGKATESAVKAFQTDYDLEVDGIVGPKTVAKLNELLPETGEEQPIVAPEKVIKITDGKSWNVRTQPNGSAAKMGYAYIGEEYAASGQTAEGWIGIIYNDEPAWVSEKAVS